MIVPYGQDTYASTARLAENPYDLEYVPQTKGDISTYRAPDQSFPYRALKLLGGGHLVVGLLIVAVACVQLFLTEEDRSVFLATAGVPFWTAIPVIATGIVGLVISKDRYWEANALNTAFFVMSLFNAIVFMPILVVVAGVLDFHYYSLEGAADLSEDTVFRAVTLNPTTDPELEDARLAMVGAFIALGLLEFVVSLITLFLICCCARTYMLREIAIRRKLRGAHSPMVKKATSSIVVGGPGVLPCPPLEIR